MGLLSALAQPKRRDGMRWIAGGRFAMGSADGYDDEGPVRDVHVEGFWIDETPVTNRQFAQFIDETSYQTFAETAPDPRDYPGMTPGVYGAGSLVFTPPSHPVPLDDPTRWWSFVEGASWRRPLGPRSDLDGLGDHPVVHVTPRDAEAYARWAGKRLATEAEWEFAARGGLDGRRYAWGDEVQPGGVARANIWVGNFPWLNEAPPGHRRTSAVGAYPKNGYGLYDMIGNVWEWTADPYEAPLQPRGCCGGHRSSDGRRGPSMEASGASGVGLRVAKGGSHLCAPNWCERYRPAARWGQPIDTSTSHMGFRCARSPAKG
ncbi:formylglycine-generating enzyme family protein [Caulobacter sp. 73W]|uniref:Formylglycine-generating enzyme family protein n=1 Tax=Caulobacter sp. 73W TaxID=3161137 RepID=A0AB39KYG0_9CAUL